MITLTPIEPGSYRVKGTDLLVLGVYEGWEVVRVGSATPLSPRFRPFAQARRWLEAHTSEFTLDSQLAATGTDAPDAITGA